MTMLRRARAMKTMLTTAVAGAVMTGSQAAAQLSVNLQDPSNSTSLTSGPMAVLREIVEFVLGAGAPAAIFVGTAFACFGVALFPKSPMLGWGLRIFGAAIALVAAFGLYDQIGIV